MTGKTNPYANEIVAGAKTTSAPRQAIDERPLPREIVQYLTHQDENLHHFTLAPTFATTSISRREVVDTWADLAAAGLLHLPYEQCSISFRRNDLLLNPYWFFDQQAIEDIGAEMSTITFSVFDELSVDKERGLAARLGSVFSLRSLAGDEIIGIASLGRLVRPDGTPIVTDAPSHADFIRMIAIESVNAVSCVVAALAARNTLRSTRVNNRIGSGKRIKPHFQGTGGTIYLSKRSWTCRRPIPWKWIPIILPGKAYRRGRICAAVTLIILRLVQAAPNGFGNGSHRASSAPIRILSPRRKNTF